MKPNPFMVITPIADGPFDGFQIDHPVDFIIVDPIDRSPIDRPWCNRCCLPLH